MFDIVEILSNTMIYKDIKKDILEHCSSFDGWKIVTYQKNETMLSADSEKNIGIVLEGKAIIINEDESVIIKRLEKNDIYGVATLFNKLNYKTKVISCSKMSVLLLNKSFIEACIAYCPRISINYLEYLAQKIEFLSNKINSYTAKTVEAKLYSYLRQLPIENNKIVLKSDFSEIAKMLGIGRASLYRAFDKLENDGLINKNNKEIIFNEV